MAKIFKMIKELKEIRKQVDELSKADVDSMSLEELREFVDAVEEYKLYYNEIHGGKEHDKNNHE